MKARASVSALIETESGFAVSRSGELSLRITETPSRRRDVRAIAYAYDVVHPEVELELRLIWASEGERWVEARNITSLLPMLSRLEGRLRLTIESLPDNVSLCALRWATPNADGWSNLTDVSLSELSQAAGVPVITELKRVGAIAVGPRSSVLGDTGRARRRLVATFPEENEPVPLLAYVLTRLAPLVRASPSSPRETARARP